MALFSNFDIAAVISEARQHNDKVLADDLQPYNDILFKIISDELNTKRDDILEQFKTKIKESPSHVKVVSVPLWTYNTRQFLTTREDYETGLMKLNYYERNLVRRENDELFKVHRANGWHWMVGVRSGHHYDWDDDYAEMTLHETWALKQVPVDLIMRKTDLLTRLSELFSGGHVWVSREFDSAVHWDDRCRIDKMVLRAHFHVEGFNHLVQRTRLFAALKDKYDRHTDYAVAEGHAVVLTGPGLAPPSTPPQSPVVPSTPKAPRRERCPTCDAVEIDSE